MFYFVRATGIYETLFYSNYIVLLKKVAAPMKVYFFIENQISEADQWKWFFAIKAYSFQDYIVQAEKYKSAEPEHYETLKMPSVANPETKVRQNRTWTRTLLRRKTSVHHFHTNNWSSEK